MPSRIFVFDCSSNTYLDCIQKSVFGSNVPWPLQVGKGDYCVLWHYEFGTLLALWRAETDGGRRLVPRAWGGKFPYQVRVALVSSKIIEIPKDLVVAAGANHLIEGNSAELLLDAVRTRATIGPI